MKISEFKQALPFLVKRNVAALIQGVHGTGKSETMRQFAQELGFTRFVDLRLGTSADAGDLIGLADYVTDENGAHVSSTFLKPDWFPKDGEKVFILLDEINQATRLLQPFIFQMALDYRLGPYQMDRNNVYIVAAMNPDTGDYSGNSSLDNKALLSRFCQIKWTPSFEEWITYGREQGGFGPDMVGFLMENESLIENTGLETFTIVAKPDRRAVTRVNALVNDGLPENLWAEVIGGMLGLEVAVKLVEYYRNNRNKPLTAEEVLKGYAGKGKKKGTRDTLVKYVESGRQDLVAVTCDNVLAELKANGTDEAGAKNLGKFLLDVPKDLGYSLMDSYIQALDPEKQKDTIKVLHDHALNDEVLAHYADLDENPPKSKEAAV